MKVFVTHRLYGRRPAIHFALYAAQPGWWFLELGSWTAEIEPPRAPVVAAVVATLVVAAGIVAKEVMQ